MTIMFHVAALVRSRFVNRSRAIAAGVVVACALYLPSPVWGQQWNTTNPLWTTWKVGIGTSSPGASLHIYGGGPQAIIQGSDVSDLKIGGQPWQTAVLEVYRTVDNITAVPNINYERVTFGFNQWVIPDGSGFIGTEKGGTGLNRALVLTMGSSEIMRLATNGYVGIGTTTPQHLLHVNGTIGAIEVIVSSTGADYVFRPDYRLRPLTEVASFIKEHHHLPEIPSEAEVKEKGVGVGDMQAKLLAKIEELTLHMIQADEKNRELQQRIAQLEVRSVQPEAKAQHSPLTRD
jgi:hypothetical protein